jgi:hypothetical protein
MTQFYMVGLTMNASIGTHSVVIHTVDTFYVCNSLMTVVQNRNL